MLELGATLDDVREPGRLRGHAQVVLQPRPPHVGLHADHVVAREGEDDAEVRGDGALTLFWKSTRNEDRRPVNTRLGEEQVRSEQVQRLDQLRPPRRRPAAAD